MLRDFFRSVRPLLEGTIERRLTLEVGLELLEQIKTRDRVRDLAEVYTHTREVTAMLDMMPDAFIDVDTRFLEPACGAGNFLVAIVSRKLALVSSRRYRVQESYEYRLLRCVCSIYGIDISFDNIEETHGRLRHAVLEHYAMDANTWAPTSGFINALDEVLRTNVICADTLKEAESITFIEYTPAPKQTFVRTPSPLVEPEHDLFYSPPVALPPVHYSRLAKERPR